MSAAAKRILVVDDNADVRLMLKLSLEHAGYTVLIAANGHEALQLQREAPADLVITDLFMPETDGFETIQALRTGYPQTKIVVMSGDSRRAQGDYLSAAALMGVHATLKKPVDVAALLQMLEKL